MLRPIVVGLDNSPESVAAADWAAREALRRGLPVELVQAGHPPARSAPEARPGEAAEWGGGTLRDIEARLRARHAGLEITATQVFQSSVDVLTAAGREAAMLVLGSRGLGTVMGFLLGTVSQAVLSAASCPVVLVRANEREEDEHLPTPDGRPSLDTPWRPVTLGLDTRRPSDDVTDFAFEAAAQRSAPLNVVHVWNPSASFGLAASPLSGAVMTQLAAEEEELVSATLSPWIDKHPQVEVTRHLRIGSRAQLMVEAAAQAGLMVVGRRSRRSAVGFHVGPVTHAVIHHATCPVAVVPYR
jgi:nucleotide-binding universal stress UspA family protein